jgi:hypothetical protein
MLLALPAILRIPRWFPSIDQHQQIRQNRKIRELGAEIVAEKLLITLSSDP